MSLVRVVRGTALDEFLLLTGAVERHLAWAFDFTVAGDLASAMDALQDAHAVAAELGLGFSPEEPERR